MYRFALALMMALFIGEAEAQSIPPAQPSAADAPRRFSGEPFGPLDPAYVRSLPAMMREGVVTLHTACLDWSRAPTAVDQEAIQRRVTEAIQEMQSGGRALTWRGVLAARSITGDLASATIMVAPRVQLRTASLGLFSQDIADLSLLSKEIADTRVRRGSLAFSGIVSAGVSDIVGYEALIIGPWFVEGECDYMTRFRRITTG